MRDFFEDAGKRVLYTVIEAALGMLTASQVFQDIDWKTFFLTILFTGLATAMKCALVELKDYRDTDFIEEDEDDENELE